jgi:hypothetical protein
MTPLVKATGHDRAFALALAVLIAASVVAFFCDPHQRPTGSTRMGWTGPVSAADNFNP